MFHGRPAGDTDHCVTLRYQFQWKKWLVVWGGAIILTFSPPYGFEGVAPGCAGGGGSTEL